MEYTKGEKWEPAIQTISNSEVYVIGGDGGVVADCYCSCRTKEECEANAHLIAAAPLGDELADFAIKGKI